jgi:hypothetical protein
MERQTIDSGRFFMAGSGAMMMSSWQLIFQQSKVNNGLYDGDRLPAQNWHWPQDTWLQKRLRYLRKNQDKSSDELTD